MTATITSEWDGLFAEMTGRGQAEMLQEAPDRFFFRTPSVQLVFERDAMGGVTAVQITEGGRTIRATKLR
ncbi:MAG TPA: hypothetical protein VES67_16390 [Vicinamibacterales bacterium]|nr:hypothetical protein [Vicinamibacterales bacterium]